MADKNSRSGTQYFTPEILDTLNRMHVTHTPALQAAFDAPDAHGIPAIQVGPSEGKLLGMLLRLAGATRVVEVGTLVGYSTLNMAMSLPENGHLWSVELDEKHAALARVHLEMAGLSQRVTVVEGPGIDVLPTLEAHGPFDAVFLDADKGNYDAYGRWAARNLRKGGLLLADNAYYFGHLLDDGPVPAAMRRCHQEATRWFDTVCIPCPDGLLLGIKN